MPRKLDPREAQRLKTIEKRYTEEERREWASKAGKLSTGKFTSEKARAASRARWDKYYEEKQKNEKRSSEGD